jgi:hypothetical protein
MCSNYRVFSTYALPSNSSPPVLKPVTLNAQTYLPNLILCNVRSLTNKVDELELVLRINLAPLAVITECWDMTTETGAIKGYLNFFNTRRDREDNRRGGGVGIYCREDLPCKQLGIPSDSCHETIWLWCKPKGLPRTYSCIIIAAIYYPEGARNRRELVTYLQYQVDSFQKQYSNPALS